MCTKLQNTAPVAKTKQKDWELFTESEFSSLKTLFSVMLKNVSFFLFDME